MEKNMEKITSRSNPLCVHIKKLGNSNRYREKHGQFICDGSKLLGEAIAAKADIATILTTGDIPQNCPVGASLYHVTEDLMDSLSLLKTPQDVLFICRIKDFSEFDYTSGTHILLDNIQDPGNVGTIIRSACAFGIDSVMLTDDSADIYNPKSVRASMGAIFKLPIVKKTNDEINELRKAGVKFIGTSNSIRAVDVRHEDFNNTVIILGNEGRGISYNFLALCDKVVKIPLSPECESLNVAIAASIIMWEASKSR